MDADATQGLVGPPHQTFEVQGGAKLRVQQITFEACRFNVRSSVGSPGFGGSPSLLPLSLKIPASESEKRGIDKP